MNVECNAVVRSIRVDTKPIRQIVHGTGSLFLWYSILFVLVDDYTIYMIDAFREVVIHIFLPTLLLCDSGLSITLDLDGRYLLEATSGGYLLVWEIPEQICKNMEYMTSKKIKKEYSLFPKYVNHSIAIDGIIWADLFGCLIGIITTKGLFRLVALDL